MQDILGCVRVYAPWSPVINGKTYQNDCMQYVLIFTKDSFVAVNVGGRAAFDKPPSNEGKAMGLLFGLAGWIQGSIWDGVKGKLEGGKYRKKLVNETITKFLGLSREELLNMSTFNFEMPYSEIDRIEFGWGGKLKIDGNVTPLLTKMGALTTRGVFKTKPVEAFDFNFADGQDNEECKKTVSLGFQRKIVQKK